MNELRTIFESFTPGAYGIWTGVLMFVGWWLREWRETRKLSDADKLARRDGYAKQVEGLQAENRSLRAEMRTMREEHADYRKWCEEQHDKDRQMIRALQDEVTGMKRALAAGQVSAMDVLPPNVAPVFITEAAKRTGEHLRDAFDRKGEP